MRIGINPNKRNSEIRSSYYHQVVVPIYIPNNDDYFRDGFEILKLSIQSLIRTIHDKTYITLVNNGSSQQVSDYLVNLKNEGAIHELITVTNIGKINALLKGIVGHNFKLVTLADADVLYLGGWQDATYSIFEAFPRTGVVCPTPSSKSYQYRNEGLLFKGLWNKNLKFKNVKNVQDLKDFAHSIGNNDFYNHYQLKQYLVYTSKLSEAVVGAGHYIATYDGRLLSKLTTKHTSVKMGHKGMILFDSLSYNCGYLRLSTTVSFARHMGNVYEEWMKTIVVKSLTDKQRVTEPIIKEYSKTVLTFNAILNRLGTALFRRSVFKNWFLRKKGLDPEAIKHY